MTHPEVILPVPSTPGSWIARDEFLLVNAVLGSTDDNTC